MVSIVPNDIAHDRRVIARSIVPQTFSKVVLDEIIPPLKAHSGAAWSVAFSPDSRTLATGGNDTTIKLWNLASLQQTATLRGHSGPVDGLAFSQDGTLLVSASGDGTARLWRAPRFDQIKNSEIQTERKP